MCFVFHLKVEFADKFSASNESERMSKNGYRDAIRPVGASYELSIIQVLSSINM